MSILWSFFPRMRWPRLPGIIQPYQQRQQPYDFQPFCFMIICSLDNFPENIKISFYQIRGRLLLVAILFLAFWIRIQGIPLILNEQFLEPDCFLYYTQAQTIAEHGRLPERDMHRWLPLGRDNTQLLSLYAYALAYTHKALSVFLPNLSLYHLSLYHWTLYAPTVCFCIGLAALCLFLYRGYGPLFSSLVGFFMATLPSAIGRSTANLRDYCLARRTR